MSSSCAIANEPFAIARAVLPPHDTSQYRSDSYVTLQRILGLSSDTKSLLDEPFFERQPLHVSASLSAHQARFASFFALSQLDSLLERNTSVFEAGAPLKNHHDVTLLRRTEHESTAWTGKWGAENQTVSMGLLKAGFNRGFTLLLRSLESRVPAVAALCDALERSSLIPCNVNLYLTPSGSQGFDAHYDWMESIVLQLDGSKLWRLWPAIHEPLPTRDLKRKPTNAELAVLQQAHDVELAAGEVLYLPRGVLHEARTPEGAAQSLHATVGVLVSREYHTWEALLHAAVDCDVVQDAAEDAAEDVAEDVGEDKGSTALDDQLSEADEARRVAERTLPTVRDATEASHVPLDLDAKGILHAVIRSVAAQANGFPLRQALPLHRARQLRGDAAALARFASDGPMATLVDPLRNATVAMQTACAWSSGAAAAGTNESAHKLLEEENAGKASHIIAPLPGHRCDEGAPTPKLPAWGELASRLLEPRCMAAAFGHVERRARALVRESRVARRANLRLHGHAGPGSV